jgi:hypothetical protein
MSGFFASLFSEMGARRRRLRAALGDRGQALAEFLVLGGLAVGSLGLLVRPWMPAAAPWGFWIPLLFVVGFVLIEIRRQASAKLAGAGAPTPGSDWIVLLWSFACALAGAAAFVIAWSAEPAPAPEEEIWTPPESSVSVDISP